MAASDHVVHSSTLKGHQRSVLCLDYNCGNSSYGCLLSGSEDCTARLWDLRERLRAAVCVKTKAEVVSVAFGYSRNSGGASAATESPTARDFSVFLSFGNAVWEYDLRRLSTPVVDFPGTTQSDPLLVADDEINQVATTIDRQLRSIMTAVDDTGSVHVWKPNYGCQTAVIQSTIMTTTAIRPHTTRTWQLASGSTDGCIRLWDGGKKLRLLDSIDMNSTTDAEGNTNRLCNPPMVHHLSFSPSGRLLAAALGDGSISVVRLDVRSFGPATRLWNAHGGAVASVAFATWNAASTRVDANDRLLCSAGNDGIVTMWDLGTSLCGQQAPLEQMLQSLQLDEVASTIPDARALFSVQHGAKPNWMVSSKSTDPFFPSTLFLADTSNVITAYTVPLATS